MKPWHLSDLWVVSLHSSYLPAYFQIPTPEERPQSRGRMKSYVNTTSSKEYLQGIIKCWQSLTCGHGQTLNRQLTQTCRQSQKQRPLWLNCFHQSLPSSKCVQWISLQSSQNLIQLHKKWKHTSTKEKKPRKGEILEVCETNHFPKNLIKLGPPFLYLVSSDQTYSQTEATQ